MCFLTGLYRYHLFYPPPHYTVQDLCGMKRIRSVNGLAPLVYILGRLQVLREHIDTYVDRGDTPRADGAKPHP